MTLPRSFWLSQQSREQLFPERGQAIHGRSAEDPAVQEVSSPKDAQVSARAALLHAGDQAEITDAGLTGIRNQLQQDEPAWIRQRVSTMSEFLSCLMRKKLLLQTSSFAGIGDLQARGLVSH